MDVLPPPVAPSAAATDPHPVAPVATRRRPPPGLLRGREDDPSWVRPSLAGLLVGTALLYLWSLGDSGWANAYYSAAAQAGSQSWKAFLFGSFDAGNAITVDKSPLFLWPMDISARLFGVNAWSILVPQALEGVAAVGVLYLAVRRWAGPAAGLIAGAVLALTPVAALMFRYNNPDSILVLLLTIGAYCTVRAVESGATRWVVLTGVCIGLGFLAKMLQVFLVVPGLGLTFLVAAPGPLWVRVRQLAVAGLAMLVSGGWWVALVALWPASSRPYVGGSQNNSIFNLIFGYNGFGRLSGNETGSVGGRVAASSDRWGVTGLTRLFNYTFGGQISWLLPAALVMLVALLIATAGAPRTDRIRASALLWGGWLVVTGMAISLGQGIIHPYYTVALAPPIGGLVGTGAVFLWRRRDELAARLAMAVAVVATAWWAVQLLDRNPDWHPGLAPLLEVGAAVAAVGLVLPPRRWTPLAAGAAGTALVVALTGPAASSWATATTPHSGAIPYAGPNHGRIERRPGFGPVAGAPGRIGRVPGRFGPGPFGAFPLGPGQGRGGRPSLGGFVPALPGQGGPRGILGGILGISRPGADLVAALDENAGAYRWVAAVVSANQAAGYQLATGHAIMAIGGFNGTDPSPTLAQFQAEVAAGRIHYYIGGGRGLGRAGQVDAAGEIANWVAKNFTATTVGGTTVYDVSRGAGGST